jgi:hypothetical protein
MRLADWPRMPYLNEELRQWIGVELSNLGVEDLAVYAIEAGTDGDERRVLVATEVGLIDHRYAPYGSSAHYRLAGRLYPWQTTRGVELRSDIFRLWAHEHRARWHLRLHHPPFEAATESPELGGALCDFARICAVMAEPFGVPAGREGPPGVAQVARAVPSARAAIEVAAPAQQAKAAKPADKPAAKPAEKPSTAPPEEAKARAEKG